MADILYYKSHLNSDFDKFKAICDSHDVNIIEVDEKEVDHLVGYLLGLDGFDESKKEVIDEEANIDFDFILFSNFDNQKMFDVIDALRNNQVNVQHKAGLTENNIKWSLRELLIENDREARTMGLIHKINGQLEKASDLKEKYGEDAKTKALIDEIKAFFKDSSIFSIEMAKTYYLKLLDENIRVENENK
ncbi:DUF3783 domain-containing protein [uncultured Anaerococcus sp.]|uniref:DUF3783 domain-containing protein n=1 Tax=uncultured Anaerococcus sp. TaxID=293428 RepID=UPI0025F6F34B|nr:DUF3783 domain-containing protein [uncultured Anaerococcus sp.]